MMPFRPVKYSWFGLAFGVVGLCVSTAMSIVTIVRCRNTWQLLVIAVWKLSMSLLNGITAIHVALLLLKAPQKEQRQQPSRSVRLWILLCKAFYGLAFYHNCLQVEFILDIPGMFAGMSELMNLVKHSEGHKGVQEITVGFYIIVGIGLVAFVLGVYQSDRKEDRTDWEEVSVAGLRWAFVTFTTLAVFYSDWVLGMMTTNLVGLPSKDSSVFYWTYFISKRLPMFSW